MRTTLCVTGIIMLGLLWGCNPQLDSKDITPTAIPTPTVTPEPTAIPTPVVIVETPIPLKEYRLSDLVVEPLPEQNEIVSIIFDWNDLLTYDSLVSVLDFDSDGSFYQGYDDVIFHTYQSYVMKRRDEYYHSGSEMYSLESVIEAHGKLENQNDYYILMGTESAVILYILDNMKHAPDIRLECKIWADRPEERLVLRDCIISDRQQVAIESYLDDIMLQLTVDDGTH